MTIKSFVDSVQSLQKNATNHLKFMDQFIDFFLNLCRQNNFHFERGLSLKFFAIP